MYFYKDTETNKILSTSVNDNMEIIFYAFLKAIDNKYNFLQIDADILIKEFVEIFRYSNSKKFKLELVKEDGSKFRNLSFANKVNNLFFYNNINKSQRKDYLLLMYHEMLKKELKKSKFLTSIPVHPITPTLKKHLKTSISRAYATVYPDEYKHVSPEEQYDAEVAHSLSSPQIPYSLSGKEYLKVLTKDIHNMCKDSTNYRHMDILKIAYELGLLNNNEKILYKMSLGHHLYVPVELSNKKLPSKKTICDRIKKYLSTQNKNIETYLKTLTRKDMEKYFI